MGAFQAGLTQRLCAGKAVLALDWLSSPAFAPDQPGLLRPKPNVVGSNPCPGAIFCRLAGHGIAHVDARYAVQRARFHLCDWIGFPVWWTDLSKLFARLGDIDLSELAPVLALGQPLPPGWPIPLIATTVWTVVFLVIALWRFEREEF